MSSIGDAPDGYDLISSRTISNHIRREETGRDETGVAPIVGERSGANATVGASIVSDDRVWDGRRRERRIEVTTLPDPRVHYQSRGDHREG